MVKIGHEPTCGISNKPQFAVIVLRGPCKNGNKEILYVMQNDYNRANVHFQVCNLLTSLLTNFSCVSIATYFGRGLRFVGSTVDDKNACRKGSMFCPFCKSNFIT